MIHRWPLLSAAGVCFIIATVGAVPVGQKQAPRPWIESFAAKPADVATLGENPYFILSPGYQLTLEGKEDGKVVRLVVTVLNETKNVGGFETRVVEERETQAGALAEVSRNYFAIAKGTNDVYYFGEDVDVYKGGKIVNHEGAWLHDTGGAKFGLLLPGTPSVGLRYYQEMAPKIAMDRAEVVSLTDRLTTPAGTFEKCLKTEETTPLEKGAREYKVYAPGVGLIQDGTLVLVARGRAKQ
jgi:hypothetical protein